MLVNATRGHEGALAAIRSGDTYVTPNQFNELVAGGLDAGPSLNKRGSASSPGLKPATSLAAWSSKRRSDHSLEHRGAAMLPSRHSLGLRMASDDDGSDLGQLHHANAPRLVNPDLAGATMSTYNTLTAGIRCPHCGNDTDVRIDFRFGLRDQLEYRLGDRLAWEGKGVRTPAGRPPDGDFEGEGYTECSVCGNSFWTRIHVRADVIETVEVDWDREEYPCRPS